MNRNEAINFLTTYPYKFGWLVGFDRLTELHNEWIKDMLIGNEDETLQGHRGSYKTTCLSIALALIIILLPNKRTLFIRKTDTDVKEIVRQVQNILKNPKTQVFVNAIYGVNIKLTTETQTEICTNLTNDIKGTNQLVGIGLGSSITGKHFDYIFTDDIVNVSDRVSKAEREKTKLMYQELQNIKNRGGKIFNTGTPWHKDDCFTLMPNPQKYDCYSTGLITEEELKEIKSKMLASLFAANYELKHIASEDVIFDNPKVNADPALVEQGICHIDAAYGGGDYTAFTIANKVGNTIYVYGRCWQKHIDDCLDEIIEKRHQFNAGKIWNETNGDKGYLSKDLRKLGERTVPYHEDMNKFLKITSFLKFEWENVQFVDGTDPEYIEQICDYNENAEHDDCPDSLASLVRVLNNKSQNDEYQPMWVL